MPMGPAGAWCSSGSPPSGKGGDPDPQQSLSRARQGLCLPPRGGRGSPRLTRARAAFIVLALPQMSDPVLEVRELVKRFGSVASVDGVSFEMRKGEILGLLGANGAGKTTAINMLLGIVTPSSGSIRVFGRDLARERIAILRRMNFCSTYTQLPGNLRVWQNLAVFGRIYRVPNLKRRIDEVLDLLEITHLKDRVSGHLSAGESTRLNLCKALLNKPELLLLDEPTASLDPDIADKVRKVTRRIREEDGTSILYTSHNMRDVEEVCDRVVFMHRGRVLATGTAAEILGHFQEQSLESLFIRIARGGEIESATNPEPVTRDP
jgi:ABC-2 type transport system ATP-binding protein